MANVSPGSKKRDNPLLTSASAINGALAAGSYFQEQIALGGGVGPKDSFPQPCFVKVKNNTGGNLARGKVLKLGTFLLTGKQNAQLWFNATTPQDPLAGAKCCILRKPLPDGQIGDAQIAGVCIAWVNSLNAAHTHASPVDNSNNLNSGTSGSYEILSALSGTGVQEAVVRFVGAGATQYGRIKGLLVTAMETTDSTHTIDNIEVLEGADPRTDTSSTSEAITISNADHSWSGDDNATARAEWNPAQSRWEFYQVTCPA